MPENADQTTGCDDVGAHFQRDFPPVSSGRPSRHRPAGRKAMIEVVAVAGVLFSISIFLAHAFDAYRTH
jgi:hypothetical protein